MRSKLLPSPAYEVAEIELVYKTNVNVNRRPTICGSKSAYQIFLKEWDKNKIELQEQFKVMLLSRNKRVLGIYEASTGGMHATITETSLIFATAIKGRASSIILAHNHPSGETKPSESDILTTHNLRKAGHLLSITVLDHIIVTKYGYFSFADNNCLGF